MSIRKIITRKGKQKLTVLTAYDVFTAKILEEQNIDIILVGDSVGTVILGYENTLPVTLEDIIRHTQAVRRGAPNTFLVADLPFASYGADIEATVNNAARLIKEAGADAVKLEGGMEFADTIQALTRIGIPVMGHIGLKPQSVLKEGYRIAGRDQAQTASLIEDAKAIETAGVFSIVLEGTTEEAARAVSDTVKVPTIGIGSGRFTDGQVLVTPDLLGMDPKADFTHNRKFADLHSVISQAVKQYSQEVRDGKFPCEENLFHQSEE